VALHFFGFYVSEKKLGGGGGGRKLCWIAKVVVVVGVVVRVLTFVSLSFVRVVLQRQLQVLAENSPIVMRRDRPDDRAEQRSKDSQ
jgi:hypothetical protein